MLRCSKCEKILFLAEAHKIQDGSILCDFCFKKWKSGQDEKDRRIMSGYISRYLSDKKENFSYILELYKDQRVNIRFHEDSLEEVRNYFQQVIKSSNKSGLVGNEIDEGIEIIGICKKFLDFLVDLEKFYKLFKKKGIETNYFEILSVFGDILTEKRRKERGKILNPAYRVISKKLRENISVENVIREFLRIPTINNEDKILIPDLLDKFNLKYDKSNLDKLIEEIQEEIDEEIELEKFEQNLGSSQGIDLGDFTEIQGYGFEEYLKKLFELLGYEVLRTPFSLDQGADLIAAKDGEKVVIQAKKYNGKVSNRAIQEIVAAKGYYKANKAIVITNSSFTKSAIDLAMSNGVELWDGIRLHETIEKLSTKKKNNFEKSYTLKKGKGIQSIKLTCPFCEQEFDYRADEKDLTEGTKFKTLCPYCGFTVSGTVISREETWTCKYCGKKFNTRAEAEDHEAICERRKE